MPGPPPPPPPGLMPPPPMPTSMVPKGSSDDRAALLKSIQKGAKLKKTVTNDKSAPMIGGKVRSNNNNNSSSGISNTGSLSATPNGLNLGGLFAGGMPKLRATGKLSAPNFNNSSSSNNNDNTNRRPEVPVQSVKNLSSVQNELKKQMASDNRNRGPPPPAPVRTVPDEHLTKLTTMKTNSNGIRANPSSLHSSNAPQLPNSTTIHRKAKSSANLSTLDSPDAVNGFTPVHKPVINHGKPNLAPKPPALNGKPLAPPKKLIVNGKPVSRAHSMKSPRSPSPQSPDTNVPMKFGTVRNLSSVIGQSLANSTGNLSPRPRPMLNGRPNAPPPSIPCMQPPVLPPHAHSQTPLPPSKTGSVKPPNHAPPPPPNMIPQPPSHTPPPPPHRTQPVRAPPAIPTNLNAPPPPPRHSSMTTSRKTSNSVDFDEKFRHMFHTSNTFPRPPPFRNVYKFYGSRQAVSKQQAPLPPNLQSTSRSWNTSSAC